MTFLTTLLDSPILTGLAKTLMHFLWQGTLIACVLYLALNALHKSKSELRYLCALMSLVSCIFAPLATFFWFYRPEITIVLNQPILIGQSLESATTNGLLTYLNWDSAFSITGILWIAGVFYLSVNLILELFSVYQLPKRDVALPEPDILQVFNRLAHQLQVNRLTRLLISLKAEVPMVVGFLRPVVLLPFSMSSGLTHSQLEMLLAHELAHVKRHDYLVNFLQTLVEITLFFHPLVKWISKQIRIEREYCCDDIAVHTCGNQLAYATALTDAEAIRSQNIPQLAMAATGGDLKNRVLRIVDRADCTNKFTRSWHSMALAAIVGVTLPVILFSAQAAYQHRVDDAFSVKVGKQKQQADIKFVTLEVPVTSTKENTETQAAAQSFAQTNERSKNQRKQLSQDHQEVLESTASTLKLKTNVNINVNKQFRNEAKPSIEAEKISDDPMPSGVKIDSQSTSLKGSEEPKSVAVASIDLNQPISAQTTLTTYLKLSDDLDELDVESPKLQIASREQLVTIIAPTLVRNARPKYPRMAIAKRAEAEVHVSFTVDVNGTVSKLSFDNNVPGYFKRSVRKALRKWRFDPGTIDGEIAAIRLSRIFTFSDPTAVIGESTKFKMTGSRIAKQITML